MEIQGYFIEWNGDSYQSVFPEHLAELSQPHSTIEDAQRYFQEVTTGIAPQIVSFE